MFMPMASIGRDLCFVDWDRDGTASQRRTPIETCAASSILWDRDTLKQFRQRNNRMRQ